MKNLIIMSLVIVLVLSSVPAFAVKTVFDAVPAQYIAPIIVGALAQGALEGAKVGGLEAIYVVAGAAVIREMITSTFYGEKFDIARVGSTVLGANIIFFL
jgi:hypothetical protein